MYGFMLKGSQLHSGEDDYIAGDLSESENIQETRDVANDCAAQEGERAGIAIHLFITNIPDDVVDTIPANHTCEEVKQYIIEKSIVDGYVRFEKDDNDDWRREQRMQAAMAFGVQGWNDWS
jgi:hypothetical protein